MNRALTTALIFACVLCTAAEAAAEQADCPPGSVEKNEEGFTWCEPSICLNEHQCSAGQVCVQMALCMEVGVLSKPGSTTDGGSRLIARQICAEGTCPQKQTCSDMKRCLPRTTAERMGKLAAPAPSSSAPSSTSSKSCGCRATGSTSTSNEGLALIATAAVLWSRRRLRRRSGP